MEWGSFLLGGVAFGVVAFILGGILGMFVVRGDYAEKAFKILVDDVRKKMGKNKTFGVEFTIRRFDMDDGDDSDGDDRFVPIEPDRTGTDFWNN